MRIKSFLLFSFFLILIIFLFPLSFSLNNSTITGEVITGNATSQQFGMSISVVYTGLPTLEIVIPENKTYITNFNLLLKYNTSSADDVWYNLDKGANKSLYSLINYFNATDGQHTLYLYANNSYGLTSKNISFLIDTSKILIVYTNWTSETQSSIDFNKTSYEALQNLTDVSFNKTSTGKILFVAPINLTKIADPSTKIIDLDNSINISFNYIAVNTTVIPGLNASALLELENLPFSNPRILKDGNVCPSSICTFISYSGGILKFNVTHFSVYSSEEIPTSAGGTTNGGGGGGGGSSYSFSEKDLFIGSDSIGVTLSQGGSIQKELLIKNNGKINLSINLISESIQDFLKITPNNFYLSPGESKIVVLDFFSVEQNPANLYLGKILINFNNLQKEILVSINVNSKDSLFDVGIKIPNKNKKVAPGDEFNFIVDFTNMGALKRTDVLLNYSIVDFNGKVIFSNSNTVAVETKASYSETIQIPDGLPEGRYFLYVRADYDNKTASASQEFEISTKRITFNFTEILLIIIIFLLLILIVLFLIKGIRDNKNKRKK